MVIEARLGKTVVGDLCYPACKNQIDKILLQGAAITGVGLPATDFFADIISSEVFNFLFKFGYEWFTVDEIILAMRMNAKGGLKKPNGEYMEQVPFYGNCFCVSFLSSILTNYESFRISLERKLQNHLDGIKI